VWRGVEPVTLDLDHRTYYGRVTTVPRLDLSTFPDSPYAAELQRESPWLRFAPPLEAEYLRARLLSNRLLIRVACLFSAALTFVRAVEQFHASIRDATILIGLALGISSSIALAAIAWSDSFERLYPMWARVLVPARNALVAIQVAAAAAYGQPEMLMALPIALIGPFFFLGLTLRTSLWCCVTTVATYVIAAIVVGLPAIVAFHSYILLAGGIMACVIAVWHLEKVSRRSFLESHLIAELAQRDPLTGTRNRRVFDEHLDLTWQQATASGRAMALLLIDIDHFKAYNDYYGHQAGDQALRQVAQTAQKLVRRPEDILTRYGGEEFAAILYDITAEQAREIAERIRAAVAELNIEHRASRTSARVTISIGVAAIVPSADRNPRGAVQLADQALYEAKVQGRNRIEVMDRGQHELMVTGVFAISPERAAKTCSVGQVGGRVATGRR
jgi:diguanylate cyclase (GGDEF)-like protein